jgi:hypothetical protein
MATALGKLKKLLGVNFRLVYQYYFRGDRIEGKNKLMVICPFHPDTTASLAVDFEKGFAYCFSCAKSWDALEFVKDKEKVGIRGALRKLAKIINLEITEPEIVECCVLLGKGHIEPTEEEQRIVDQRRLEKLAYRIMSWEFGHKAERISGARNFNHYIQFCYDEFERVMYGGMTARKLDEIKDKVRSYLIWLNELLPILEENYQRLQREGQQERTGEFLGVWE